MINIDRLLQREDKGSTLFMVSADDLKEFAEILIEKTIKYVEGKYEPKYYTKEQLAETLHVSKQTIDNYCKKGILKPIKNLIPGSKRSTRILFDQREVRTVMSTQHIGKYMK